MVEFKNSRKSNIKLQYYSKKEEQYFTLDQKVSKLLNISIQYLFVSALDTFFLSMIANIYTTPSSVYTIYMTPFGIINC